MFWSEIGSGFGEPGGTLPPTIPKNSRPPTPPPPGLKNTARSLRLRSET